MTNAVAVITGGSSGLGEAAALRFARDGYDVVLLDVDKTGGERVADVVRALGRKAAFQFCDVGNPAAVDAAAQMVSENFGPVEVLVTSAALQPNPECIMTMDMDWHDKMWRVNYFGTVYTCQAFARLMIPNNKGSIVTLGSIHSRMPLPLPGYNVIKVAIERFTQLLAVELGRFTIRVNCVGPTHVMTPPLLKAIAEGERDESKIMAPHALPYLPEPEDVAGAIAFLASDQAKAITGVLLPIDSGIIAGDAFVTYAGGIPWLK
ncbi:SDR family oxidoreductase [Shinella zoogloeoides]|uniref:SDR family NAD(P)-dependent oxidoreductase n=1 Tax=Shinella zoogloeoides TaxID=352475 RepID=UPI00299D0500|nr:SDR family oxidoreductase [Shinella zoogloeoides]WPE24336.1 Galactitol 2-dehydrogenase [Shinella zoogloeoides]